MDLCRVSLPFGGVQLVVTPRRTYCTAAALRRRLAVAMATPPDQMPTQTQVRNPLRIVPSVAQLFCSPPPSPTTSTMHQSFAHVHHTVCTRAHATPLGCEQGLGSTLPNLADSPLQPLICAQEDSVKAADSTVV